MDDHDPLLDLFNRYCAITRNTYLAEANLHLRRTRGDDAPFNPERATIWDGGTTQSGRKLKPAWPSVVKFARDADVFAPDLVLGVFDSWAHSLPPTPHMLCSVKNLDCARRWRAEKMRKARAMAAADLERFAANFYIARKLSPEKSLDESFRQAAGTSCVYSPLVLLCAALKAGAITAVRELFEPALLEYLPCRDEWKRALPELVPEDMDEMADDPSVRRGMDEVINRLAGEEAT